MDLTTSKNPSQFLLPHQPQMILGGGSLTTQGAAAIFEHQIGLNSQDDPNTESKETFGNRDMQNV